MPVFINRSLCSVCVLISADLPLFSLVVLISSALWLSSTERSPRLYLQGLLPGRRQSKTLCVTWQHFIRWICLQTHFSWWRRGCLWHSQGKCQPFFFFGIQASLFFSPVLQDFLMKSAVNLLDFVCKKITRLKPLQLHGPSLVSECFSASHS